MQKTAQTPPLDKSSSPATSKDLQQDTQPVSESFGRGSKALLTTATILAALSAPNVYADYKRLQWDPYNSAGTPNAVLRLWVSTNSATTFNQYFNIPTNTSTTALVLNLPPNKTVHFKLTAFDPVNMVESIPSNILSVNTVQFPPPLRREVNDLPLDLNTASPGFLEIPPTNSQPMLSMTFSHEGTPIVHVTGVPSQKIKIQSSPDMQTWSTVCETNLPTPPNIPPENAGMYRATFVWNDPDPTANKNIGTGRFYRTETTK